ncbi:MAG: DNA mismatch repair endonuclease MutL [Armatimonadetes bacterium]|nr:DNA mismatch repair endonuclease MutL [Armatimonadota bacterium]HOM83665.1 DNA mismatch repair endonuclease MutL [Armatimonadota bacterium]HPO73807.1 DNA mismatch repair endonuclease MutL [Armatimonadota bacterium]
MPKVVVLPKEVADKIAAGEVVDRPASVVKELVENSIDAGATRVEVELEEGGKRRITVTDNGCGMLLEDAVLALERHATSKIRAADDLFSIRTLGFRGEALPSIAAVSHLRIQTRAVGEDTGVEVTVDQGGIAAAEHRGVPQGTQVTVTHLFSNVPARLKFLKTTQTELSHIIDLMVRFALSYPGIHFKLAHNGRIVFQSPGSGDPLNTVVAAYGREVAKEMLPVASPEETPVRVRGYTSRPSMTRTSRSHQAFFVNGRLVRSPLLSRALDEAYKGYVPAGRYPVACLFIDVDPAQVDVNVHPTKMEVRFASEREVFSAAVSAIRRALMGVNLAQPAFPTRVEQSIQAQTVPDDPFADPDEKPAESGKAAPAPDGVREPAVSVPYSPTARPPLPPASCPVEKPPEWRLKPTETQPALTFEDAARAPAREEAPPAVVPAADAPSAPPAEKTTLPNLTPVARVLDTYLICEGPDAIYIIDQHAAHERVIYDALMRREENDIAPQPLLIPLTLNLSHSDAAALESHREALQELGFEIEPFGRDTYVLRSVPSILVGRNYEAMLRDLLDDLRERERTGRLEEMRSEICALVACHSVTRSGDPLSPEEMARLVQDLRASPSPYTCAHGRPTLLVLSRSDLERQIGRG